jgi:hypothetical protein
LPVLRANVDGAPFEAIPDTVSLSVSHNNTLGRYVLMSESLRIRGSQSRRPNQKKNPHPLRYLTPRGSFPVISSSRSSRPEPMKSPLPTEMFPSPIYSFLKHHPQYHRLPHPRSRAHEQMAASNDSDCHHRRAHRHRPCRRERR